MIDDALLHKWVNGTISEEELREFKKRPEYSSLKALYDGSEGLKVQGPDKVKMLEAILGADKKNPILDDPKHIATKWHAQKWLRYGIAASVIFIISFLLWPRNQSVLHSTQKSEQLSHFLPDGSEVILNAESSIFYHDKKWTTARSITLNGEAYFDVMKGSKFSVKKEESTSARIRSGLIATKMLYKLSALKF